MVANCFEISQTVISLLISLSMPKAQYIFSNTFKTLMQSKLYLESQLKKGENINCDKVIVVLQIRIPRNQTN